MRAREITQNSSQVYDPDGSLYVQCIHVHPCILRVQKNKSEESEMRTEARCGGAAGGAGVRWRAES
jgi:hypothetical protein